MTHRQRKHENISTVEDCLINLAWTSLCYQSSLIKARILQRVVKSITLETCLSLYVFVCGRAHSRVSWSADFCMLDHPLRGYNINP
jgi:hypothetical protein